MGLFAKGQIISLAFPFSDLSRSKDRPALILADAANGDWIICQITSNPYSDSRALSISTADFDTGGLPHTSYLRPAKLFTASESRFYAIEGSVTPAYFAAAVKAVIQALQA